MGRARSAPVRALTLLALLAGCSTASPEAPDAGIRGTTSEPCADLVVIGARGSTQDPDLNGGVGTEVRRTVEALTRRLSRRTDLSVHVTPIRYDSAKTSTLAQYLGNTADGSRLMTARLRAGADDCPGSRFALIGFSQGAQVVHGVATRLPTSLARRVALVAMIADPLNNPGDDIARWSYAPQPTTGRGRLGAGPPIDADLRRVAISLCVAGDEICNDRGAPGGPPSDTHRHFYERPSAVQATAAQLDAVLRRAGL
jgi:cutinase